jgi:uncharacterized repeat protein (TIGR03803 family)
MRTLGLIVTLALILAPGSAPGAGPLLTTLYRFTGQAGAYPEARVIFGSNGSLYGTTIQGGVAGRGTIFQLSPPTGQGKPWTSTALYSFGSPSTAPGTPNGGLVFDTSGALYGVTANGGASGKGAVYQLNPPQTGGKWTEAMLYSFTGQPDGATPVGDLTFGQNGALYGATTGGGSAGQGTIFELAPPSAPGGVWTENIVYSFAGGSGDGAVPQAGLLAASNGTLYGTTYSGGVANMGVVFSLVPPSAPGGTWTENILYTFQGGTDGANPWAALVMNKQGALFGTTYMGGTPNMGTVFELAPPSASGGAWTETLLYTFQGGNHDGAYPQAKVVFGNKGRTLYGTTGGGGIDLLGTVFKLAPAGSVWTETVLYQFQFSDGSLPVAGLAVNASGVLFGTTENGGTPERGTVFRLVP